MDGQRVSGEAVRCLRRHLDAGDPVLVVTACAQPVAGEVCRQAGLGDVEILASNMTRTRWGFPRHVVVLRGERKVRALKDQGVPLPVDHAYSDSATDLPLLSSARTPHIVSPSASDLKRIRQALGEHVNVVNWQGMSHRPAR